MNTIQTDDTRYVRDMHSKALLTTDRAALENHRLQRTRESIQAREFELLKNCLLYTSPSPRD